MRTHQKRKSGNKILLTGGHAATTAISVVEELMRRRSNLIFGDIYWVGAKSAFEGKSVPTLESQAFPNLGVESHHIVAGKIRRGFSLLTVLSILKIPVGFIHALLILGKIKPDLVLSFGGFAALPVVVGAKLMSIPVVIHEQTMATGRANKASACFADKILLAHESSSLHYPKSKTEVVGNPVMTQIAELGPKKSMDTPPTIYVTGGSRGAQTINELIEPNIKSLLRDYLIIHQTGEVDYQKFVRIKNALTGGLSDRYEVYSTINPMQLDNVYRQADIIVSRAGANTVSELMIIKRPAILIPIPWSNFNEQLKNAMRAKDYGVASVLEESRATSEALFRLISKTRDNWSNIVSNIKDKKTPDIGASGKIVDILEGFAS